MIVIDPILRASRLQMTVRAIKAANQNGVRPILLTAKNRIAESGLEEYGGLDFAVDEVFSVPDGFWYGKLGLINALKLIAYLARRDKPDFIYVVGVNEWHPFSVIFVACAFLCAKIVFADYNPPWPHQGEQGSASPSLRSRLVSFLYKSVWAANKRAKVLIFDERIDTRSIGRDGSVVWLPDPPPAQLLGLKIDPDQNSPIDGRYMLLVGTQSKRKGLHRVVRLAREEPHLFSKIGWVLAGRLTEDTLELESDLQRLCDLGQMHWINRRLSEEELFRIYSGAYFTVIPYDKEFTGSSGVLVSSSFVSTPVIASSHGLIGARVRKNRLGICFNAGSPDSFKLAVKQVVEMPPESYRNLAKSACEYGETVSNSRHIEGLKSLMFGAQ